MQRAVKLHPAVVMLALLAGGTLGGFFGLLLAVPAAATLKIVIGHLWRHYVLDEPLDEIEARWEAEEAQRTPGGFIDGVHIEDEGLGLDEEPAEPSTEQRRRSDGVQRQPSLRGAALVAGHAHEGRTLGGRDLDGVAAGTDQGGHLRAVIAAAIERHLEDGKGLRGELVERAVAVTTLAEVDLGDGLGAREHRRCRSAGPRSTP